ncbi:MAG: glycosyltransferase family 2 protein [Methyloligellaceae bacterium]
MHIEQPLVTIGITTWNAADTVKDAVVSALSQNWHPIEIVIVDDCSEDETPKILHELAAEHPEINVYFNAKNSGVAATRNQILAEATGEFLAFFDDDDYSEPDRITKQLQRITEYERQYSRGAPVICHTARYVIYPNGEEHIEPAMGQDITGIVPYGRAVARRILMGEPIKKGAGACPTCSQMARLSTYRMLNGFDPELRRSEDTEFAIRLALRGGHFTGISTPLVIQKMTPTSEKSLEEERRNMLYMIDKHRSFMEASGQYRFSKRWIEAKQAFLEKRRFSFIVTIAFIALCNPVKTIRRLIAALPNFQLNRRFSRFHEKST